MDDLALPRPLTLYIWPRAWALPSIDPHCTAALLFLHLHFPAKFAIVECSDPDLSPTGTLPFLAHVLHTVGTLGEIIGYLSTLDPITLVPTRGVTVDQGMTPLEKQETVAWKAYIDLNLGNLLSLAMYADISNYTSTTLPTLARDMPLPLRYYLPRRIRAEHTSKLERIGWGVAEAEVEETTKNQPVREGLDREGLRKAFLGEKHVERAGPILADLDKLLGGRDYIFQDRPTLLDVYMASYLSLIIFPPFPDNHISSLIRASHNKLYTHAHRMLGLLPSIETIPTLPPPQTSFLSPFTRTLSSIPMIFPLLKAKAQHTSNTPKATEELQDAGLLSVGNLMVAGVALGATLAYSVASGWVRPSIPDVQLGEDILDETVVVEPVAVAGTAVIVEEVTLGVKED